MTDDAMINHPEHYTSHPSGVECIQVVEHMSFNVGNAIKYLWRADLKGHTVDDLKKAAWYVQREIERRTRDERCAARDADEGGRCVLFAGHKGMDHQFEVPEVPRIDMAAFYKERDRFTDAVAEVGEPVAGDGEERGHDLSRAGEPGYVLLDGVKD